MGAGVEIKSNLPLKEKNKSHPAWGAGVELRRIQLIGRGAARRTPRGVRELKKFMDSFEYGMRELKYLDRDVAIAYYAVTPYGVCELK